MFKEMVVNTVLVVTLGSYHYDRGPGYNEFNPGIGVEIPLPEERAPGMYVGAGAYYNSFKEWTYYFGAGVNLLEWRGVTLGVEAGRVWGYEEFDVYGGATVSFDRIPLKFVVNHELIGAQWRF